MSEMTTFIDPSYRPCSGRRTEDGVLFKSYSTGIDRYCHISEDGLIKTSQVRRCWHASVIGHGPILAEHGKPRKFRSHQTAARAAIKIHKKLHGASK